jgi:hypothetical protein
VCLCHPGCNINLGFVLIFKPVILKGSNLEGPHILIELLQLFASRREILFLTIVRSNLVLRLVLVKLSELGINLFDGIDSIGEPFPDLNLPLILSQFHHLLSLQEGCHRLELVLVRFQLLSELLYLTVFLIEFNLELILSLLDLLQL